MASDAPPQRDVVLVAPSFGARGQFVVSGGSAIGASHYGYDSSDANGSSFEFSPGVDLFVAKNISIGIDVDASYVYQQGYAPSGLVQERTTYVGVAPRVGLNVPVGRMVSFYPRVALGYETTSTLETGAFGGSGPEAPTMSRSGPFTKISAQLLFHPIRRFYFGFGPDFFHGFGDVSGGPNAGLQPTTVGLSFVMGGYWGGEPTSDVEQPASPPPHRRFGDAGEFVLTNESLSGANFTSYAGGDLQSSSFNLAPDLDYFVANHVSVGVGAYVSGSHTKSFDLLLRTAIQSDSHSVTIHGTLGVDLPIGEWLSLYPRAYAGFGSQTYDSATTTSEDASIVYVGIEAPLLVHPGPQVFVGFGPDLTHELSRSITFRSAPGASAVQNRQTNVDAFFVLGAWL